MSAINNKDDKSCSSRNIGDFERSPNIRINNKKSSGFRVTFRENIMMMFGSFRYLTIKFFSCLYLKLKKNLCCKILKEGCLTYNNVYK